MKFEFEKTKLFKSFRQHNQRAVHKRAKAKRHCMRCGFYAVRATFHLLNAPQTNWKIHGIIKYKNYFSSNYHLILLLELWRDEMHFQFKCSYNPSESAPDFMAYHFKWFHLHCLAIVASVRCTWFGWCDCKCSELLIIVKALMQNGNGLKQI